MSVSTEDQQGTRAGTEVSGLLLDAVKEAGVTLTAALPDDWVLPLLNLLDAESSITNVHVAREPEIVTLCSGAFFGGVRSLGVLGSTGLLTCMSELCSLNIKHQVPLFLIVSLRSGVYEHQSFQEVQSRTMLPLLETLQIPYVIIDTPAKISLIPPAYKASRLHKRPYIAWLTKSLLTGEQSDF